MTALLALLIVIMGGLITLWIVAENHGSKRKRITLGLIVIIISLPIAIILSVAITQLDDQSYYAASVKILLDENIDAIAAKEVGFLARLQAFRASQRLTYETRGDLLENTRRFRDEGKALRNEEHEH